MTIEAVIDLDRDPPEPEPRPVDSDQWWWRWRRPVLAVVSIGLLGSLTASTVVPTAVATRVVGPTLTAMEFEVVDGALTVSWPSGVGTVHRLPSGEEIGSMPSGRRVLPGSGGRLTLDSAPVTITRSGDGGRMVTLHMLGTVTVADADGSVRWAASDFVAGQGSPVLGALPFEFGGEPLVLAYDREGLTVRDAWTGEVRARGPWSGPAVGPAPAGFPPNDPSVVAVAAVGGVLAVTSYGWEQWTTSAYDSATLTPHWHQVHPAGTSVEACGQQLCLHHAGARIADGQLTVLDPVTGDELWQAASTAEAMGEWLLLDERTLVDPATGEELLDLAGWEVFGPGLDGELLVGRPVVTHSGDGSRTETVLAEVPAADPTRLRPRGTVPDRVYDCVPFDGGVVCGEAPTSGVGEGLDWGRRLGIWQF